MHDLRFAVALAASAILIVPAVSAQQSADSTPRHAPMGHMGPMGAMDMTMMHDSADARLDSLVAAMNAAKGDRKVKAMAQVINELVAQRKAMHEHMRTMMRSGGMRRHPDGDSGMMHHDGMGGPPAPDSTRH